MQFPAVGPMVGRFLSVLKIKNPSSAKGKGKNIVLVEESLPTPFIFNVLPRQTRDAIKRAVGSVFRQAGRSNLPKMAQILHAIRQVNGVYSAEEGVRENEEWMSVFKFRNAVPPQEVPILIVLTKRDRLYEVTAGELYELIHKCEYGN